MRRAEIPLELRLDRRELSERGSDLERTAEDS